MVQEIRREGPTFTCMVSIASLTGVPGQELTGFGTSEVEARQEIERLLVNQYGCDAAKVQELMAIATTEQMAPFCAPQQSLQNS